MLTLNYRDSRPIYEQIMDGLRKLVISGAMQENDKLPSVRELAASMAINPNTIQRAYRELEAEGYLYSIVGRGSFVSAYEPLVEKRKIELLKQMDDIFMEMISIGIDRATVEDRLKKIEKSEALESITINNRLGGNDGTD